MTLAEMRGAWDEWIEDTRTEAWRLEEDEVQIVSVSVRGRVRELEESISGQRASGRQVVPEAGGVTTVLEEASLRGKLPRPAASSTSTTPPEPQVESQSRCDSAPLPSQDTVPVGSGDEEATSAAAASPVPATPVVETPALPIAGSGVAPT